MKDGRKYFFKRYSVRRHFFIPLFADQFDLIINISIIMKIVTEDSIKW